MGEFEAVPNQKSVTGGLQKEKDFGDEGLNLVQR
jgi:hypothetical protein